MFASFSIIQLFMFIFMLIRRVKIFGKHRFVSNKRKNHMKTLRKKKIDSDASFSNLIY